MRVSYSYTELFRCVEDIHCRVCSIGCNSLKTIIINQYKVYCSLKCYDKTQNLIVNCDQCTNLVDSSLVRHSFATGTGMIRSFCSKLCFKTYREEMTLCYFCSNPVPNVNFIMYQPCRGVSIKLCNMSCMLATSMSTPDSKECLNCRAVPTESVPNVLQHYYSDGSEHWCSLHCKLEYGIPFAAQIDDNFRSLASVNLKNVPLFCAFCCLPLAGNATCHLFAHGRMYRVCSTEECKQKFRVQARKVKKCQVCRLSKYNSDMFEVASCLTDASIEYFCSLQCLKNFQRIVKCSPKLIESPLRTTCLMCEDPLDDSQSFYCSQVCQLKYQVERASKVNVQMAGSVGVSLELEVLLNCDSRSIATQTDFCRDVLQLLDVNAARECTDSVMTQIKSIPEKAERIIRLLPLPLPCIISFQLDGNDFSPMLLFSLRIYRSLLSSAAISDISDLDSELSDNDDKQLSSVSSSSLDVLLVEDKSMAMRLGSDRRILFLTIDDDDSDSKDDVAGGVHTELT